MKHLTNITTIIIFSFLCLSHQIITFAATTPEATSSQEITKEVVDKIKDTIDKNAQSSAVAISQNLIGVVTTVDSINSNNLLVTTKKNENLQIAIQNSTTILDNNKNITIKDLSLNGKIIIIGERQMGSDIVIARRIINIGQPSVAIATRMPVFGTVTTVDTKTRVFSILRPDQTEIKVIFPRNFTPTINSSTTSSKVTAIVTSDSKNKQYTLLKAKFDK